MLVTPGIVLTSTESITHTKLNLLGTPTVALETADVNSVVTEVQEQLGNGVTGVNYFRNETLALWTAGSTAVNLVAGVRTERADDWWARPDAIGSTAPTYGRAAAGTDKTYLYLAEITGGDSSTGNLDFGQDLSAMISVALIGANATLTFDIYNDTGSAFTPTIRLDTCDSFETYTSVTNRISVSAGTSVASGAWKTYTVTLDTDSIASYLRLGALVYIRLPAAAVNGISKVVKIADLKIEVGDIATARAVPTNPLGATADNTVEREYLFNPDFAEQRWGTNISTITTTTDNYVAQGWWCYSTGLTPSYTKATGAPSSQTLFSAKIAGNGGSDSAIDFGQNLSRDVVAAMSAAGTVSFYIFNNTGAEIAPVLRVDTCDTAGVYTAVTNRINQTLQSCPNGVWTRVQHTFTGGDLTNWSNGARLYLRFASGTIGTSPANYVQIAQAKAERGSGATTFLNSPIFEVPGGLRDERVNLVITRNSVSAVDVSADGLVLQAGDGSLQWARSVSLTGISIAGSGAGGLDTGTETSSTWYSIWVIGNGTSVAGLLSTSATSPTLPAGYRYKAFVGWVRNDGSSNFIDFTQHGWRVWFAPILLGSFTAKGPASTNTYESVATAAGSGELAKIVPSTARAVLGIMGNTTDNAHVVAVAGTSGGVGEVVMGANSGSGGFSSFYGVRGFRIPLVTAQLFYWKSTATTAQIRCEIVGYEL